jgi:transposase
MRILGLDLGTPTSKSAASLLDTDTALWEHTMIPTRASEFVKLMEKWQPQRVVMEATQTTGWVVDVLRALGVEIQVISARDPAWLNRSVKNDREDAKLLAILSINGQVRTVAIPETDVRDWRSLITSRQACVAARTQVKNSIRALLMRQGESVAKAWTQDGLAKLRAMAKPLAQCGKGERWRGLLDLELQRLADAEKHLKALTDHLDAIGEADPRVCLLQKHDGVGPRLAETVVAFINNPHRFATGKQVAAYAGLTPRLHQSGKTNRTGGITGNGNPTLRGLLVEVSWLAIRRDGWMRDIFNRVGRGDPKRKHIAIIAVARHLLIRLWANLRDNISKPPPRQPAAPPAFAA